MKKVHLGKLKKFLILVIILILYTLAMVLKYGWSNGPLVSLTTWSFFVFCTPIADAGFIIDFPVRFLLGIKMVVSEMIVWLVAFIITSYSCFFNPIIFEKTGILNIFNHILNNLYPYGIIIIMSAIGTFLSVEFGDEIFDKIKSRKNKKVKYSKIFSVFNINYLCNNLLLFCY